MSDFGGAVKQSDAYEFAVIGVPYDEKSSFRKTLLAYQQASVQKSALASEDGLAAFFLGQQND